MDIAWARALPGMPPATNTPPKAIALSAMAPASAPRISTKRSSAREHSAHSWDKPFAEISAGVCAVPGAHAES